MNRKDTMILSYEHEDVTITLDEMEVISNRLLRDPKATEQVSQYLDDSRWTMRFTQTQTIHHHPL